MSQQKSPDHVEDALIDEFEGGLEEAREWLAQYREVILVLPSFYWIGTLAKNKSTKAS